MTTPQNATGGAEACDSNPSTTRADLNAAKHGLKRSCPAAAHRLPPRKIALIQVAKAKVGMAEEVYRQMLHEIGGVDSSTELDAAGFAAVMDRFGVLGFVNPNNREASPLDDEARRAGMATLAQRRYVRGLWRQWHGSDDPKALRKWLQARYHVADLRFATDAIASMAIEGLKAMLARQQRTTNGR